MRPVTRGGRLGEENADFFFAIGQSKKKEKQTQDSHPFFPFPVPFLILQQLPSPFPLSSALMWRDGEALM